MSRYLLVAYQTAGSPELLQAVESLLDGDPDAEFVLLVPLGPPGPDPYWERAADQQDAQREADLAGSRLKQSGVRLASIRAGDGNPFGAVNDELRHHPEYAAIVICTKRPGVSAWLKLDLVARVRRRFPACRLIHVTAQGS